MPSARDEVDPRLIVAYDESVRAWAHQSAVLDELRSRAGTLIAAASVSSAFLGAATLRGSHSLNGSSVAAIVVFGVVIALCIYVLWPAKDWVFVHNAKLLLEKYMTHGVPLSEMYERMTCDNAGYRQTNAKRINYRFMAFRVACAGLGADVILWLLALTGRG
jgi:hypothetical protein